MDTPPALVVESWRSVLRGQSAVFSAIAILKKEGVSGLLRLVTNDGSESELGAMAVTAWFSYGCWSEVVSVVSA